MADKLVGYPRYPRQNLDPTSMKEPISKNPLAGLRDLWSLTQFGQPGLTEYAEQSMFRDTQKGIIILAGISMLMLLSAAILYRALGFGNIYLYTCLTLTVLSLHIAVSARTVREIRVLYLLGITLLVLNAVAFVLLAHQTGSINSALLGSVILLFLVMPLVPWGLREALAIILLVYLVFTLSTNSVEGRFDGRTLWVLQYIMVGSGIITLIVVGRNIVVRKHDLATRFELEKARERMELLSLKDPLTGAWNRRFLEQRFDAIVAGYRRRGQALHFALIDIDNFKQLNDHEGHNYGDLVLRRLASSFMASFSGDEYLIRVGGDEFALVFPDSVPEQVIERAARALDSDRQLKNAGASGRVRISTGIVSAGPDDNVSLEHIYRLADDALYRAKARPAEMKGQSGLIHVRMQA